MVCPDSSKICLLTQSCVRGREDDLNRFFLHFDKEIPFYNDLSSLYKNELVINRCNIISYQNHKKLGTPSADLSVFKCYTGGKVISVQSSINFSHVTCSYGRSEECLEDRNVIPTASEGLRALQQGNLFGEAGDKKNRRRPLQPAASSTNISDIPVQQQVNEIHDFLQNLTSSSEINSSTNITDVNSAGSDDQPHSDSVASVCSSRMSQSNRNSSKGQIITINSDSDECSTPQPQTPPWPEPDPSSSPTLRPAARGGAAGRGEVSNPIWGQESFGPFLPMRELAGTGSLLPLPGSQQPGNRPSPPAGTRNREVESEANPGDTPKSSKTSSNTTLRKKSVRPALSIVFDNTPAINEPPMTSQGFPGSDLPAVLPSGHATPTLPSEVRTRSSRRTKKK